MTSIILEGGIVIPVGIAFSQSEANIEAAIMAALTGAGISYTSVIVISIPLGGGLFDITIIISGITVSITGMGTNHVGFGTAASVTPC